MMTKSISRLSERVVTRSLSALLMLMDGCAHRAAPTAPPGPHPCARVAPAEREACLREHGAILFAVGQEPGWMLVLSPDAFSLELDYGETRLNGDVNERHAAEDVTRFSGTAEGKSAVVEVRERTCRDVMSGEPYPVEVAVTLPGRVERGCGFFVRD